jgi:hypothetical protein
LTIFEEVLVFDYALVFEDSVDLDLGLELLVVGED